MEAKTKKYLKYGGIAAGVLVLGAIIKKKLMAAGISVPTTGSNGLQTTTNSTPVTDKFGNTFAIDTSYTYGGSDSNTGNHKVILNGKVTVTPAILITIGSDGFAYRTKSNYSLPVKPVYRYDPSSSEPGHWVYLSSTYTVSGLAGLGSNPYLIQ